MIDLRETPEAVLEASEKPITKGIRTVKSWIKPVGAGRIGIGFNYGKNEIFIGVSIAKILTETIVRRSDKKVLVRSGLTKIIDL